MAGRVADLRTRIAGHAPGRNVELVAVTKGFGPDAVLAAAAAGCTMVGENYAQEARAKLAAAGDVGVRLHFIGNLQSNKVRQLAPIVDVWESIDRPSLLGEVAKRRPGATVLVQVNAAGEAGKGGCRPEAVADLVREALDLGLDVDGLMAVGPTSGEPGATRRAFELTRSLTSELDLPTCSMGMSHDLEIALECGATRVRIGTALFGERH